MLLVALPVMNEYLFINSAGLVPVVFRQEVSGAVWKYLE
jgi:hypothetical protein